MQRFWLLLLALVLPVQMSWAAIHVCDGSLPVAAVISVVEHADAGEVHQEAADAPDYSAEKMVDAFCGSAHGCHGLHSLMSQGGNTVKVAATPNFLIIHDSLPVRSAFSTRHERPQWLAA